MHFHRLLTIIIYHNEFIVYHNKFTQYFHFEELRCFGGNSPPKQPVCNTDDIEQSRSSVAEQALTFYIIVTVDICLHYIAERTKFRFGLDDAVAATSNVFTLGFRDGFWRSVNNQGEVIKY